MYTKYTAVSWLNISSEDTDRRVARVEHKILLAAGTNSGAQSLCLSTRKRQRIAL